MAEILDDLGEVLASPIAVTSSKRDSSVALYYRECRLPAYQGKYLCVVVKSLKHDAFLTTAMVARRIS